MDLRDQNFGIEIEMTGITRRRAAEVVAEYLGEIAEHEGGGYDTYSVRDNENRKWKFVVMVVLAVRKWEIESK